MAVPLSIITVVEQRSVIRFLWSEGVKPSEIYRSMMVQYGDSCLSQGRVYEWAERFRNGRQNINDKHRSGRPVSVASETVKQQVEQRIRDYRRVTVDEIAAAFNMALRAILSIMTSGIGKCVADGSQGSCPIIISVHSRRFVSNVWTVMLVKEMLFSIKL